MIKFSLIIITMEIGQGVVLHIYSMFFFLIMIIKMYNIINKERLLIEINESI